MSVDKELKLFERKRDWSVTTFEKQVNKAGHANSNLEAWK